jgi:penicillin-binding protein 2
MMDGRDSVRYRAFTRRTMLLSGGTLGLFALLAGRMFQLSVLQREQFSTLAEDNRINLQLLAPLRGLVYDRTGVQLANTSQNFRVLLIPEQTPDVEATLEQLAKLVPIPPQRIQRVSLPKAWRGATSPRSTSTRPTSPASSPTSARCVPIRSDRG